MAGFGKGLRIWDGTYMWDTCAAFRASGCVCVSLSIRGRGEFLWSDTPPQPPGNLLACRSVPSPWPLPSLPGLQPFVATPRVLFAQIFPDASFLLFGSQFNIISSRLFPKATHIHTHMHTHTHAHTHTHTHTTLYHSLFCIFFKVITSIWSYLSY